MLDAKLRKERLAIMAQVSVIPDRSPILQSELLRVFIYACENADPGCTCFRNGVDVFESRSRVRQDVSCGQCFPDRCHPVEFVFGRIRMANFNAIDASRIQLLSDHDRVDVIEVDPRGLMTFPQRAVDQRYGVALHISLPGGLRCSDRQNI